MKMMMITTSSIALMLAAAPAAAQTTAPTTAPTGQTSPGISSQTDMMNMPGNQMGATQPGQPQPGQSMNTPGSSDPAMGSPNSSMAPAGTTANGTYQGAAPGTSYQPPAGQGTTGAGSMGSGSMGGSGMGGSSTDPNSAAGMGGTSSAGTGSSADQTSSSSADNSGPTSPDGTPAFGIEPYFGIVGGYHLFDRERLADQSGLRPTRYDGALVGGVLGINIPLGPVFVGVEGHGARGFGDIRWEYGARGRAGFRAGDSGLVYASAGYTWSDALNRRGFPDRKGWMWGIGLEAGPRDIGLGGITSNTGLRFRLSVETADFSSIRPMGGVVFHF